MAIKGDRLVKVWNVGKLSYSAGLKLQKHLVDLHNRTGNEELHNTVLCLEHEPVYTTGIRDKLYSVEEENKLRKLGADFHRTNRGGLITFHGPGQLVVYPILNLKHFKPSVRWYVCSIEKTIIDLCKRYDLNAETSPHTGVWIGNNKICAIGIHRSSTVTSHGLALNCSTDLTWFDHIVPCGILDKGVTSLTKELDRFVSVEEVLPRFLESFEMIFQCDVVDVVQKDPSEILNKP